MHKILPYLTNSQNQENASRMELAVSYALAMQRRDDTGIPFVRKSSERPTAITRILWPLLLRRSNISERYFFVDTTGILGETIRLTIDPKSDLPETYLKLNEDDSFDADVMRLAEYFAELGPLHYPSHVMNLFSDIASAFHREYELLGEEPWGTELPVSEEKITEIRSEMELISIWQTSISKEQDKIDKLIKDLREVGGRRIE